MQYVGLTNDLVRRRQEHGNPPDWKHYTFSTEVEARNWEKNMIASPGYEGGTGGEGWQYGYTYTITSSTIQ